MGMLGEIRQLQSRILKRRWFLGECGVGLGGAALSALMGNSARGATGNSQTQGPHFAPQAKRVVYLFHAGAPSHLELFDNKPALTKHSGQLPPAELLAGYRSAFINPN